MAATYQTEDGLTWTSQALVHSQADVTGGKARVTPFAFKILNTHASQTKYLFLYDSATVGAGGSVAKIQPTMIPAGAQVKEEIPWRDAVKFGTSCSFAISTTPDTLTLSAADCMVEITFKDEAG